jgi:hypothetical protein
MPELEGGMSHKPASAKPRAVNLFALPCGGFEIRDPFYGREHEDTLISQRGDYHHNIAVAAFSTLDQALDWLAQNMAQPVSEPKS